MTGPLVTDNKFVKYRSTEDVLYDKVHDFCNIENEERGSGAKSSVKLIENYVNFTIILPQYDFDSYSQRFVDCITYFVDAIYMKKVHNSDRTTTFLFELRKNY